MTIEELGKRAVACKHWRWMRGMLASNGEEYVRIFFVSANHLHLIEFEDDEFEMVRIPTNTCLIPDLSDPATLGCLLALVRKARREPGYAPSCLDAIDGAWVVETPSRKRQTRYASEAEAIVVALEAAP